MRRRRRPSRTIAPDFKKPYTWQSSIGFQKQINAVTGFDVDLTHWNEYRDTRTIDANLVLQPGDRLQPANRRGAGPSEPGVRPACSSSSPTASAIRPRSAIEPDAPAEEPASRRGVTYTLMLEMKDNGTIGYGTRRANNPFDYLDGEWATSPDFQRNTVRLWGLYAAAVGLQRPASPTSTARATDSTPASRRRRSASPAPTG